VTKHYDNSDCDAGLAINPDNLKWMQNIRFRLVRTAD
jgi:hypothetical protein